MFLEILTGILIGIFLLYLYLIYLGIADKWNAYYYTNISVPDLLDKDIIATLDSYQAFLPPIQISDGYKYVNFWLSYYTSLYSSKLGIL
jgi:hypothetical protein